MDNPGIQMDAMMLPGRGEEEMYTPIRQQTESGPDLKAGQLELNNRQQTESGPVLKVV